MKKLYVAIFVFITFLLPTVSNANMLPMNANQVVFLISLMVIFMLLLNAFIEAIIGTIYILIKKKSFKILLFQFIANIITWIPLFFLMTQTENNFHLFIAEIVIVISETYLIKLFAKDKITLKESFHLSLISNTVSLAIGIIFNFNVFHII